MKRYKLLKELPLSKVGEILEERDCSGICICNADGDMLISTTCYERLKERGELDEWLEEVKNIQLPEKIHKALQAWIDAQDEKITALTYSCYLSSIQFESMSAIIEFEAEAIDGLEDGCEYTLEELGLEA